MQEMPLAPASPVRTMQRIQIYVPPPEMKALAPSMSIMIAVATCARRKTCRIRPRPRLGQAITREMVHAG